MDRVERHAADCVAGWEHQFDARVGAAHRHGAASRASFLAQAEKCAGDMVIALLARLAQASTRVDTRSFVPALSLALLKVRHETLSIFLSPVCIELTRWMRVFAVITLILIVLTVDVWRELSLSPAPH